VGNIEQDIILSFAGDYNWRIKAEDLLAILILVILTLGIALYLQFIIRSGLYNAEEISQWPLLR